MDAEKQLSKPVISSSSALYETSETAVGIQCDWKRIFRAFVSLTQITINM